jgi:Domain of unknown function (DUF4160)
LIWRRLRQLRELAGDRAGVPGNGPGQRSTRCAWVARCAGARGSISWVPTISRFYGIVIAMYFDDHGHPHFHARHAGAEAKVRFDQVEVIDSTLQMRDLRLVLAWVELHRGELLENWRRARAERFGDQGMARA